MSLAAVTAGLYFQFSNTVELILNITVFEV